MESIAHSRLIQGKPGVGKTWFGCQLAQYELSHKIGQDQKILFLTFARNAVARINEAFTKQITEKERKRIKKRLRIDTFAGFFWWLVESYGRYTKNGTSKHLWLVGSNKIEGMSIPEGYEGVTFDELEVIASKLLQIGVIGDLISDVYPLIIIDEFQDVSERLLNIIIGLGQKSKIVLLNGPGQCIYRNLYKFDPCKILEKCRKNLCPVEFPLKPTNDQEQRYCSNIKDFLIQFENDNVKSSTNFPVKFTAVPLRNRNGNPNRLDIFAALELRAIKQFLEKSNNHTQNLKYAVLASTNSSVAKIHKKIIEGAQGYCLYARPASLLFGDSILLQYGRLMLELLRGHWIAKKAETISEQNIAKTITLLFQEHDNNNVYQSDIWLVLAQNLIQRIGNMRAPNNPMDSDSRLKNNIETINKVLRARREDLPNNCPSTPFDRTEITLLKFIASEFTKSIMLYISLDGKLDIRKASWAFEKANQQKVIFEKQGIQKNVQVMTIHKAKGREFDGVILVLESNRKAIWQRNDIPDEEIEDLYRVAVSRNRSAFSLVAFADSYPKATRPVKRLLPSDLFPRNLSL